MVSFLFRRNFFILCIILFSSTIICHARNIVIPTYYGYGVISQRGGWVYPYIVHPIYGGYSVPSYGPYNIYCLQGLIPYHFIIPTPYWTGASWVYPNALFGVAKGNINVRSYSKKTKNNVIGMLRYNEPVYVLGSAGNWYYIQSVYNPGTRGYAHKSYIELANFYPVYVASNFYIPRPR